MSPEDHARIAAAVQAAEAKTVGEIYCVVARASDSYFFPAAFMVTLGHRRRQPGRRLSARPLVAIDLLADDLVVAQLVAIACALTRAGLLSGDPHPSRAAAAALPAGA